VLSKFRSSLPLEVSKRLNTIPTRHTDVSNRESMNARGRKLWDRIHRPYSRLIESKLQDAHPDLPVFIINYEYGFLLAESGGVCGRAGGMRTSLSAIACLRAQDADKSQLLGHIHGLKKAWEDNSWSQITDPDPKEAVEWLVTASGSKWLLDTVDELVRELGSCKQNTENMLTKGKL
jgi:hypothetical protein